MAQGLPPARLSRARPAGKSYLPTFLPSYPPYRSHLHVSRALALQALGGEKVERRGGHGFARSSLMHHFATPKAEVPTEEEVSKHMSPAAGSSAADQQSETVEAPPHAD